MAGNYGAGADDLHHVERDTVDCQTAREALSASLDGEDPGLKPVRLDQHLAGCPACRRWHEEAAWLNRRARLSPAGADGPDLTEAILARLPLARRRRRRLALRIALLVVALTQLGIGLSSLFGPLGMHTAIPVSAHMDHEEAAFNLAFAIALLLVAVKPQRALAQVPVLGSFVLVLVAASAVDLADSHVTLARLATHVPIVAGLLLTAVLARHSRTGAGPAGSGAVTPRTASPGAPRAGDTAHPHPIDADPASEGHTSPAAHRKIA